MILRLAAFLLLFAQPAAGLESGTDDTLRFHRVLVPEARINDWPSDGRRYLPMDASAFEQLIEAAKPASARAPSPPPAKIATARYEARLVGERLIGTAALDVVLLGTTPAMLPLEPCNLCISAASWSKGHPSREADLGLAADGKSYLRAERSDRLALQWSLAARRDPDDALSFSIDFPPSASSHLSIDLPNSLSPLVDRGIVLGDKPSAGGLRRWEIECGGNRGCHLRICAQGGPTPRRLLALLRESRTYECSLRGLDVSLQWRLEAHNQPLRQITLLVDPELSLVSARLGESEIPWSIPPATGRGPTRLVLTLPEPISDCERVIRLSAIGRTVLDRSWRLPRIRCPQLSWQEGAVTLLVPEPLLANRIVPHGCAQTDAGALGSPRSGQSAQFQCFDPDAVIEVLLASPTLKLPDRGDQKLPATTRPTPAGGATPNAVNDAPCVKECRVQSWYRNDGAARHLAAYELRGSSRRFELQMPASLNRQDIRNLLVDGSPAAWRWIDDNQRRRISLRLPADNRRPCITVEWIAATPRLGIVGSLSAIAPKPTVPVLASRWVVVPPPGYEPADVSGGVICPVPSTAETSKPQLATSQPLSWTQRLLGPLARANADKCFDPLNPEHWQAMFAGFSSPDATTTAWQIDLLPQSPATITLVHRPTVQWLGNIVLLLTVALGGWTIARRPSVVVALLGVLAALALVLPAPWAPLATGGVLGAIFSLLWRWIRLGVQKNRPQGPNVALRDNDRRSWSRRNSDSTVSMAWPTELMLLAALSLPLLCGAARGVTSPSKPTNPSGPPQSLADDSSARARKQPARVPPSVADAEVPAATRPEFAVLVPIDGQRNPVGGKLLVPEPLYQELHRRAAAAQRPAWMLVAAHYQGQLVHDGVSGRFALGTLQAEYDLRVFDAGARVQLPLDAPAAGAGTLLLDGQPVELANQNRTDAEAAGAIPTSARTIRLSFIVAEPGPHRLQISLRPTSSGGDAAGSFELPVPRVPIARLDLALPSDAPLLDVPSAIGAVKIIPPGDAGEESDSAPGQPAASRLAADLGPTDRLAIRWTKPASPQNAPAAVQAERLLWLKVQPGSVVIAAKFKLHVTEGRLAQVQLAVDPKLRLLPLSGDDPPTVKVGADTGRARMITFCWPRPISGETTIDAAFLMSGASGVGNLSLPLIDLLDVPVAKRWLAVSVDPALDHREQQRQGLPAASVADFLKAWNAVEPFRPQVAYRLPAGPVAWTLATRPHEPHCAVEQTLNVGFNADHADILFEARLSVTAGYVFQHRLTATRGLNIERVSVVEGDVERGLRWAQDDDGITIFLSGPASGVQKLTIRGQIALQCRAGQKWSVPAMRLEKHELRSASIRLFQQPTVLLNIDAPKPDALSLAGGDSIQAAALGRLVATIPWDGSNQAPATVTVKPAPVSTSTTAPVREESTAEAPVIPASIQPPPDSRRPDRDPLFLRMIAAAGLLLLAVIAIAAAKRGWLTAIGRHSHAAALLLGVAWWLWLAPSILGLVIAIASALSAAIAARRSRAVQSPR